MTSLFWQTIGTGNRDLVLLHGWGLNASVWSCIIPYLSQYFRLKLVDLPGYGQSRGYSKKLSLEDIAEEVALKAPTNALWLGWSLGGLVAATVALNQLKSVSGLIIVASSPRFCAEDSKWPGIQPKLIEDFIHELYLDNHRTISRFLSLQTLGTKSAFKDARWLKSIALAYSIPNIKILIGGLSILINSDLRLSFQEINIPLLRIYGYLDNLVPHKVIPLVDKHIPTSKSFIFTNAAHVPFISHSMLFCKVVYNFVKNIN